MRQRKGWNFDMLFSALALAYTHTNLRNSVSRVERLKNACNCIPNILKWFSFCVSVSLLVFQCILNCMITILNACRRSHFATATATEQQLSNQILCASARTTRQKRTDVEIQTIESKSLYGFFLLFRSFLGRWDFKRETFFRGFKCETF